MTPRSNLRGSASAPQWILTFLGAYLAIDLFVLYLWNAAGQAFPIQAAGDGGATLPVTAMACVDLWLCLAVLRSFPARAPLRSAWLPITWAAAAQAVSGVLAQLLGTNWPLNPLVWSGHGNSRLLEAIRNAALLTGGPVRWALLAAGMLAALRLLRRFGFRVRPGAADWAMPAILGLFFLWCCAAAGEASLDGHPMSWEDWISLAGQPLLCVLFLQATLLRQAVARMGNGLISQCWAAFMYGIFLTGFGELALWVIPRYTHAWPVAMADPLMRFASAAVFALAPACQVAAQWQAIKPAAGQPVDLPAGAALNAPLPS
jgi:hypothetical protein